VFKRDAGFDNSARVYQGACVHVQLDRRGPRVISSGYTKLFSTIVASTIWNEDNSTRIVWITLLALSDSDGYVAGSIPGLATLARVSVEECKCALERLQQPDEFSRSPEHEGRRIEVVDGGWLILNRIKYRDLSWEEDKAQRHRLANQRYYRKQKAKGANSDRNSDNSNPNRTDSDGIVDKKEKEKEKELNTTSSSERNHSDKESISGRAQTNPSQDAVKLAALLKTEILRNKPDYKVTSSQLRKWGVTAERMIRIDERDPEEIADVIRWAQRDEFWMANILSMDKLREKCDQLQLKRDHSTNRNSSLSDRNRAAAEEYVRKKQIATRRPRHRKNA